MDLARWRTLMSRLGAGEHADTFTLVHTAYSETHRRYHTVAHIDACLQEFDSCRDAAGSPDEVEAALWFHDLVYEPRASDNERRSAEWASAFLASAGVRPAISTRVHDHIMATTHQAAPNDPDSALVVDIDLSVLGKDPARYDIFETQIRDEYAWVPGFIFRRKRAQVLQSFLDRPSVYSTALFRERYETAARVNLRRAIDRLTG